MIPPNFRWSVDAAYDVAPGYWWLSLTGHVAGDEVSSRYVFVEKNARALLNAHILLADWSWARSAGPPVQDEEEEPLPRRGEGVS